MPRLIYPIKAGRTRKSLKHTYGIYKGRSYDHLSGSADPDDFVVPSDTQRFLATLDPGKNYVRPRQLSSPSWHHLSPSSLHRLQGARISPVAHPMAQPPLSFHGTSQCDDYVNGASRYTTAAQKAKHQPLASATASPFHLMIFVVFTSQSVSPP